MLLLFEYLRLVQQKFVCFNWGEGFSEQATGHGNSGDHIVNKPLVTKHGYF